VRNPDSLTTYLSLSSSSHTPLLTLWTTAWCPTCRRVLPLLRSLLESGVGEQQGGVAFAPVEFDSPDMAAGGSFSESLPMTYMITAVPTLLSFRDGEPQTGTKVVDGRSLVDGDFLARWIRREAERGRRGGGGGGDNGGGGAFAWASWFGGGRRGRM
ncbi:hypothetical protein E4U41_003619, partial [Claviceps citrina]